MPAVTRPVPARLRMEAEEEPPEVADGPQERSEDKPQRRGARQGQEDRPGGADGDEGTATGNPRSAGSDE